MKLFLVGLVILILGTGGFIGLRYLISNNKNLPSTAVSTTAGKIKVIKEGVSLTHASTTKNLSIDSETDLIQGDKVTTDNSGVAVITYVSGSVARLGSNTAITFNTSSNLQQYLGKVFVRFKKILGGSEDFSVETPTMVATVRGTAFASIIKKDVDPKIIVSEDNVEVEQKDENTGKRLGIKQVVNSGEQLEYSRTRKQLKLAKAALTSEEKEWVDFNNNIDNIPASPSAAPKTIKPTSVASTSASLATPSYGTLTQMPGSGYHRGSVGTSVGNFLISCVGGIKGAMHVITDSGNDSDCANNCTVFPLDQYATRNGGYAAINGMYFCPADYVSCAGKTNSFDTLFFNSRLKKYINSANNVYSTLPFLVINSDGSARFIGQTLNWGRDTSIQAGTAGNPMLVQGGNIAVVDSNLDDKQRTVKSNRGAFVESGNTIYLCIVGSATVPDSAQVYKALKVDNAINIDGGGSSAMWLNGSYVYGPGRQIPTAIIFK